MMIGYSIRSVVALEGSSVVGFVRAICDESLNGYISMIAVSPNKRRQGIASKVVTTLIDDNHRIKWVLTSDPRSIGFWEKQGFIFPDHLMARPRVIDSSKQKDTSSSTTRKRFEQYGGNLIKRTNDKIQRHLSYILKMT